MTHLALHTDHYELTMVQAALRSGAATRHCVFEVFTRSLLDGRRYGVCAGLGRLLAMLPDFRFDEESLGFLASTGVVDTATCEWLSTYRFSGSIDAYAEGEVYFPGSPVLVVEGAFAECVLLETLVLSVLNHDSAVATAAARMVCAAGARPCIEMGSRRTHEEAAVASARAAYLAGFSATSNLAAGLQWGVPTTGTAAHAFVLVHDDEAGAFAAQVDALGIGTTLLVDTYDVEAGIRAAVAAAGPALGAVRLDSGDLLSEARRARELLDGLGATAARIVVTSDLDEGSIARLAGAPVDAYGVGTSVVTGGGVPTAGFVYKLVAIESGSGWQPVQKRSAGKHSVGGRKSPVRRYAGGTAAAEQIYVGGPAPPRAGERPLLVRVVDDGAVLPGPTLTASREHCRRSVAELPQEAMKLSAGDPAIETQWERVPT
ncbi:MAG: nicotinate phosphoribosyltransferase [Frankiaceae bacterium]|nr:nicotinate phosphoribosyltransferase [Frankiaceae bacterium]